MFKELSQFQPRMLGNNTALDAASSGMMAFLEGELEKRDPKLNEPLMSFYYPRDMPIQTGGGWVETTSNQLVTYTDVAPNAASVTGNSTTQIPFVGAVVTKDRWPVYTWQKGFRMSHLDLMKSQHIGRDLDNLYNKAVRMSYEKHLDQVSYLGQEGNPGLINQTSVSASSLANGASGFSTWSKKTANEILNDINTILISTLANSGYDAEGMADTILVPYAQFAILSQPMTTAGSESIYDYLLSNNLAKALGRKLEIFPCLRCSAAGTSGTDRLVAYSNSEDKLHLNVCVPIQRVMTTPTYDNGPAYVTGFQANIGVVKILYPTTIGYFDGV